MSDVPSVPAAPAEPLLLEIPWGFTKSDQWARLEVRSKDQMRFWQSKKRIIVVPAGRRTGKTMIVKRKVVATATYFAANPAKAHITNARFIQAAPVHDQAKEIFWLDAKSMYPDVLLAKKPNESDLTITLLGGVRHQVRGLDRAPRVEGSPIDGIAIDEFGNIKPNVWMQNVRPALGTRGRRGWAIITGVPRGGTQGPYAQLVRDVHSGQIPDAEVITWPAKDIVPAQELDDAKRTLDPKIYAQEYDAKFTDFGNRAYYAYEERYNTAPLAYDPRLDLVFCFDFNKSPGIAVILQEQHRIASDGERERYKNLPSEVADQFTAVLGEIWIPEGSNTPLVCKQLIEEWGHHRGRVHLYGDLTGGQGSRIDESGSSDWDVILKRFSSVRQWDVYDQRGRIGTGHANPAVASRVNAVNARCFNAAGESHLLVDPRKKKAPHMARDLEGCLLLEGTNEIDKKSNKWLSHLSDALGYYIAAEFPIHLATNSFTQLRY